MRTTKVTCDVCGAEKRETNHWYMVSFSDAFESVSVLVPGDVRRKRVRTPYDPDIEHNSVDVCGKPCAIRLISERLK
jgi:hypothetical protein